eukprot:COSAG06_NODE_304_length_17855_cov_47.399414_18_plen_152_part_00
MQPVSISTNSSAPLRHATFCHAIYIYNASFYQDRLGTNKGKALKKRVASRIGTPLSTLASERSLSASDRTPRCGKRGPFLRHFYTTRLLSKIDLPRQARDKHSRDSTQKKRRRFLQENPHHIGLTMLLNGVLQKNLVLVGGAMWFPRHVPT